MQKKGLQFSQIYDVRAVRVLVPEVRDCYTALGIVHTLWRHIPKNSTITSPTPRRMAIARCIPR